MPGRVFCECLGGFAACGLLRKKFSQASDRRRTMDASVFSLKQATLGQGTVYQRAGACWSLRNQDSLLPISINQSRRRNADVASGRFSAQAR